jgi:hypothetical protein
MAATDGITVAEREARREEWRRILEEQAGSGKSAAVFCRARGLAAWKFHYWRKALAPPSGGGAAHGFVRVKVRTDGEAQVCLVRGPWRVYVWPG